MQRAWIPKGEVLQWNAVSSKSTCGRITISTITANVPSKSTHAAELIFREPTAQERTSYRLRLSTSEC